MAEPYEEPLLQDTVIHTQEEKCNICLEPMEQFDVNSSVKSPCCKNSWFHKECLKTFADYAGIEFKCPICRDVENFCKKMKILEIEAPMR